jgi:uncharacterized membrane protein YoaK (UPF0700 family)
VQWLEAQARNIVDDRHESGAARAARRTAGAAPGRLPGVFRLLDRAAGVKHAFLMPTPLRDAWATLVPRPRGRHGPLPPLLIALTVASGVVDAFSYLVLGHVFVANMTGNVVFLAFSIAGTKGFSLAASSVSLLSFVVGGVLGGRLGHRVPYHRGRLLLSVTALETVLVLAAYGYSELITDPYSGAGRYALIVVLAIAMGAQNAAVRLLAVPDLMTTNVLTSTITGMAADGRLAAGGDSRIGRRLLSVAALFLGALVGAFAAVHAGRAFPLLIVAGVLAVTAAATFALSRSNGPWTAET